MALYVSVARRTRRTALIAVAAALVALAVGWAVGRTQVPSIDDRVTEVQAAADQIATNVERLDIEYAQVVSGSGDTITAGVITPLHDARVQLQQTMNRAPWVVSSQRGALLDTFAAVESSARHHDDLATFRARLNEAGAKVRSTLGAAA